MSNAVSSQSSHILPPVMPHPITPLPGDTKSIIPSSVNNGYRMIAPMLPDSSNFDNDHPTPAESPVICSSSTDSSQHTINQLTDDTNTIDGINLDDIKEFSKQFKLRRLALGLTQTQVGQALSAAEGPAYSQSAICRWVI